MDQVNHVIQTILIIVLNRVLNYKLTISTHSILVEDKKRPSGIQEKSKLWHYRQIVVQAI